MSRPRGRRRDATERDVGREASGGGDPALCPADVVGGRPPLREDARADPPAPSRPNRPRAEGQGAHARVARGPVREDSRAPPEPRGELPAQLAKSARLHDSPGHRDRRRVQLDQLVASGVRADKIHVIYSGTDTDRFNPAVDGSGIRRELDLGRDVFLFTQIGVRSWKGNDDTIDALALAAARAPRAPARRGRPRSSDPPRSRRDEGCPKPRPHRRLP